MLSPDARLARRANASISTAGQQYPASSAAKYLGGLTAAGSGSLLAVLHREDGLAAEYADGTNEWWKFGGRHHDDGPAVEWSNGDKEWWTDGKLIVIFTAKCR